MARYHINAKGEPAICRAVKGHCRYGAADHFETEAEAWKVADERHLQEYLVGDNNLLPDTSMVNETTLKSNSLLQEKYHDKSDWNHKLHRTELVKKHIISNGYGDRAGIEGEVYAGVAYAQSMDLNNTIVVNSNGKSSEMIVDSGRMNDNQINNAYKRNVDAIINKLNSNNVKLTNISPVRAIHFSDDGNTAVVQMGAPNVPDIAIVKNGNVEFVEVKDLHKSTGSQIDSITSEVGENNVAALDTSKMPPKVRENLKIAGFNKTIGTNYTLNQLTYNDGLQYFIKTQKDKGVSHFAYIGRDNQLHDVSLDAKTNEIASKLEQDNIRATLIMRSNEIINNTSPETLKRWKTTRAKDYFKSGIWPKENKVKLRDFRFKKGQISIMKNHLCIGEMVLPVKMNKTNDLTSLDFDKEIDMNSIRSRQLTLTGNLKQVKK